MLIQELVLDGGVSLKTCGATAEGIMQSFLSVLGRVSRGTVARVILLGLLAAVNCRTEDVIIIPIHDTTADAVLGQPDLTSSEIGAAVNRMAGPYGIAINSDTNRIFVSEFSNNRVLSWPSARSFVNG